MVEVVVGEGELSLLAVVAEGGGDDGGGGWAGAEATGFTIGFVTGFSERVGSRGK